MIINNIFKKAKRFLLTWDGIWSFPLAVLGWMAYTYFGEWMWGEGFGGMSPAFLQAVLYAALALVGLNFMTFLGLYFNFRAVFNYFYNESKSDFKTLLVWQKISLVIFLYSLLMVLGTVLIVAIV